MEKLLICWKFLKLKITLFFTGEQENAVKGFEATRPQRPWCNFAR